MKQTMNKLFLSIVVALAATLFCGTVSAQSKTDKRISREQLAEKQAKHIAQQLAFDDKTTQLFVAAYCDCQKEFWALGPRAKSERRGEMSDKESEQALKNHFEQSEKILAIRKKYYKRYSEFLTQKQIMRVYEIEEKMMRTLKEVKEHQRREKIETEKRETMKKRAERGKERS
ncbi:MAG: hypothetical protein ACI3Y0_05460 [Prevotella sp.]